MKRRTVIFVLLSVLALLVIGCKKQESSPRSTARQSSQPALTLPEFAANRTDITDSLKYFAASGMTYEVSEASIDNFGVIHAVFLADDYRTMYYQMNNYSSSLSNARKQMASIAMFGYADDVFKMFPSAKEYNVWVVNPVTERDRYGNEVSARNEVIAHLMMTRSTCEKINWVYMRSEWVLADHDFNKIASAIDNYRFDPRYFE